MSGRGLLLVIATAVVARAVMAWLAPPAGGLVPYEPSRIAASLNAGEGFVFEQYGTTYRAWKEPLSIVLLAAWTRWLGSHPFGLMVFQGLFGAAAAVALMRLAYGLLGDGRRATVAGVLAAANPFLVYYDTHFIHPLSLDCWLFLMVVGSVVAAAQEGPARVRRVVWAGLVMGLTLWERAVYLAAGIGSWMAAILSTKSSSGHRVMGMAGLWLGIALLLIAPWMVRNYRLFHRLVVTTDAAHILWLGNNPSSNGTYSDQEGTRVFYLADPRFQQRVMGASELEQYDLFLGEARRFIKESPAQFGALVHRRLWAFVWFSPNAGVDYAGWERVLYQVWYAGLLGLGVVGLRLFWRRATSPACAQAVMVLAAVAGLAIAHALTAINMKHRVPFELVLAIFAAETIAQGIAAVRR